MEEISQAPLARITYVCSCGADHIKLFELYFEAEIKFHMKFCGKCRAIKPHIKILPKDDDVMNYRKPTNLPSISYDDF